MRSAFFLRMRPDFHELTDQEKREAADELMLPTGVFGALVIAALLIVAMLGASALTNETTTSLPISIAARTP